MIFRGASKQFSIPYFWAFLACAVFRFLAVIPFVIDDDEAWWAVSARWLKHPGDFYRSVPDVKTPGSVWFGWGVSRIFGALGFDPNVCADPRVIRFVFIGFTLICALLLGKIGQRFHRKSFWFSALFFLTASVLPSPKLLAFTGDGLMALFVICGYAVVPLGESSVSLLFAGVFLAFGLLVKQTAIFAAFPLLFSRSPKKWSVPELSWIFLGSLSVLLPSIWALGFQEMIFWVWTYPKEILIAVRGSAFASPAEFISNSVVFFLALLPLSIAAFRFRPTFNSPLGDSPLFDFRVQWLLAGLLVILAGKGLFLHYYLMAVPPLALLLADVYSKKAMRPWETLWLGIGYAACCILVTIPALQVSWGTDLPYFSRLQKAIAPALKAEDSVLVWGGSPLPLAYSGARPATRFFLPRYAAAP